MKRIEEKLTAIGDAIREKTGGTELLSLDEMPSEIAAIETGIKTDDATAVAGDILSGKTAYAKDAKITGTIPTKTQDDLIVSEATITVPSGYYNSQVSKSVTTTTQAVPSISINNNGLITASTTQTAGYVTAGTKSATKQLTTKAAATITPSTSNQTIAAGTYLTGVQTIAGDTDLVAGNIKKGVNIFGVAGSYDALTAALNFTVVGGTTKPTSPAQNTIWVNTSTTITSWVFSSTQPTNPTAGMVHFLTGSISIAAFNALKSNTINVYPAGCSQYINGAWVSKTAVIYQSGAWKEWVLYLYNKGVYSDTYGGLNSKGIAFSGGSARIGFLIKNSASVRICPVGGGSFIAYFSKMVDLTPYKQLCYYGNAVVHNSYGGIAAFGIGVWNSSFGSVSLLQGARSTGLHTLDISNINGNHYIGIAIRGYGTNGDTDYYNTCTMEQMYLK